MSWTDEVAEDAITLLCEITGIQRSEAITRLKANNNDPDRAASEYFDDPTGSKYKWDESAFAADRQGESGGTGISFNIQGPDDTGSFHNSAAPTRPPSRTNSRSPMSRVVDLTASQATGVPTSSAQEDEMLQRALAESAAESGLPPQESGIIGDANAKHFGPANRNDYELDQWAMVPTKIEVSQTKSEPEPSARKRDPEAPAFLRSSKDNRLGAIVSILHKIPLARNTLLSSGQTGRSYGHNSEWWKGQPILKPESLEALARDEQVVDGFPHFSEELHRLIAFLDGTDRTYGSVDVLAETEAVDPSRGGWMIPDVESKFFEALETDNFNHPEFDLAPFLLTARTQRVAPYQKVASAAPEAHGEAQGIPSQDSTMWNSDDSDDEEEHKFSFFDVPLDNEQGNWVNSLYDIFDVVFWSQVVSTDSPFPNSYKTVYLSQVSDILSIRISGPGLKKPCDVPAVLYMDRYMEARKDQAIQIQAQIGKIRRLLTNTICDWEKNILTCKGEAGCREQRWFEGKPHGARECWERIIKTSEYVIERQQKDAQWRYIKNRWEQGIAPSINELWLLHTLALPYKLDDKQKELQEKLEASVVMAKEKLEDLDTDQERIKWRREQCYHALNHLSKWLTIREDEADAEFRDAFITPELPEFYHPEYWTPSHRLLLRGVATTSEITYVCTRRDPDLIDLGDQAPRDQWWRLVYAPQEASPIAVEKTDLDTVLLAAGTESKNPILIYATEAALDSTPTQVSDSLRMFVRADNRSFQHELAQEEARVQALAEENARVIDEPIPLTAEAMSSIPSVSFASPAKRKHSSGNSSVATIASTDSRDLDMTFSDQPETFPDDDDKISSFHQEFVSPTPQHTKLGGLVESLENCRTYENESPVLGRRDLPGGAQQEMQPLSLAETAFHAPEMQERSGGLNPFLVRPGNVSTQKMAVDIMDIDSPTEHHEELP
ncbi:hypothetical protein BX600DRAFT_512033 [Xylariales sp. PMI_506]|nr:hypothetical protein BX600DRAFT_512033 [Xylariales sp. PMI_506]